MKSYKKDSQESYSIGVFPTLELLKYQPHQVERVFISSLGNKNTGVEKIKSLCISRNIPVETADAAVSKLSKSGGIYAVGVFKKYDSSLHPGNQVVIVHPEDTGNLGTIIRSLASFNISNLVLIRPAVDIFDPKVIRSSMGAVFQINFAYYDSFSDYQNHYRLAYYPFLTTGLTPLPSVNFNSPCALIFGSESAGLPDDFLHLGQSVRIPQTANTDSLNLSLAVGIATYHLYVSNQPNKTSPARL